jgi:hypothetical protein
VAAGKTEIEIAMATRGAAEFFDRVLGQTDHGDKSRSKPEEGGSGDDCT